MLQLIAAEARFAIKIYILAAVAGGALAVGAEKFGYPLFSVALAHDQDHPELAPWFRSLHNGDGTPCCDNEKEAHHLKDVEWDTSCSQNNFGELQCHYRVYLHDKWRDVPAASVVQGPNKLGPALVWEMPTMGGDDGNQVISDYIRCFLPGAGL